MTMTMAASSLLSLRGVTAAAATTLLLLLLHPQSVSADCLVEGDMMFVEGQSIGTFGLVCVNETSFDTKDKVCGPDGEIILVTTSTETCSPDTGNPYCVQCGSVEQGAALCLETMDAPEVCTLTSETGDDAFGNLDDGGSGSDDNFEMLPPSTPATTSSSGGGETITFSTITISETISFSAFDQCDNTEDIAAWSLNNISQDGSSIQYCTTEWNGGCYYQGDCTQECFVSLGFSERCSTCFGNVATCVVDNDCQSLCEFDEDSEECADCRRPCVEALDECSGVSAMLIDDSSSSSSTTSSSTSRPMVSSTTATTSATAPESTTSTSTEITSSPSITSSSSTIPPAASTASPVAAPSPDASRTVASGGKSILDSTPSFAMMACMLVNILIFTQWIGMELF